MVDSKATIVYYREEAMNLFNATSTSQVFLRESESVLKVMSVTLEHLHDDHQEKTVAHQFDDTADTQILVSLKTSMPSDLLMQPGLRNGEQAHDFVQTDTATSLNDQAILSYSQGDYTR